MKKPIIVIVSTLLLLSVFRYAYNYHLPKKKYPGIPTDNNNKKSESSNIVGENSGSVSDKSATDPQKESAIVFSDDFSKSGTFEEAGSMNESASKDWWVNSGAFFNVKNGVGMTLAGDLAKNDKWQKEYEKYDPDETDKGIHPQNIFRLVLKSKWKNLRQESYCKIDRYIISDSENRSESNGLLLFNRYVDENNLYYTGVRVDGTVVIKKKIGGKYYTMAQKVFYPGRYDRKNSPNLLPVGKWIGIRSEVFDNPDESVSIRIYIDGNRSGDWKLALTADDNGKGFGGAAIMNSGYAGIRTDFMDAEIDDYRIEEIK
ncbi:MAG: hypothetical protein HGB08_01575 [Candidatus Moranbacteria bacterium]|nr:hypothetical protein [Candidatus Moranbacteria bacterium]